MKEDKMNTNFNKKLQAKIAAAQLKADKTQEKAMDKLLENENFIESQRTVSAKEKELTRLNEITMQLNSMAPYVARDGRKFSVNVFPLNIFGTGIGEIMGIIAGSRGAFVAEKMLEYSAISGIGTLELQEAQQALGSPAYYKDGKVFDAIPGDFGKLSYLLQGIFIRLGMSEFQVSDVTKDKHNLYFALAEGKANKQLVESQDLQKLEKDAKDFVLEQ